MIEIIHHKSRDVWFISAKGNHLLIKSFRTPGSLLVAASLPLPLSRISHVTNVNFVNLYLSNTWNIHLFFKFVNILFYAYCGVTGASMLISWMSATPIISTRPTTALATSPGWRHLPRHAQWSHLYWHLTVCIMWYLLGSLGIQVPRVLRAAGLSSTPVAWA